MRTAKCGRFDKWRVAANYSPFLPRKQFKRNNFMQQILKKQYLKYFIRTLAICFTFCLFCASYSMLKSSYQLALKMDLIRDPNSAILALK